MVQTGLIAVLVGLCYLATSCAAASCPDSSSIKPCLCKKSFRSISVICLKLQDFAAPKRALPSSQPFSLSFVRYSKTGITDDVLAGVQLTRFSVFVAPEFATISSGAFKSSINTLEILNFEETKLTEIPIAAVKDLKRLKTLKMKKCSINDVLKKADSDALPKSLRVLEVAECGISGIENKAFKDLNIKYLSVMGNQIKTLPVDALSPSIHNLHLERNKFTETPIKSISGMVDGSTISLSGNPINHLESKEVLKPFLLRDFVFVYLFNPIKCDDDIKWLLAYKRANPKHYKLTGYCIQKNQKKCYLPRISSACFA